MNQDKPLHLLVVTNMYPLPEDPSYGVFVADQVESLLGRGIKVDVLFINGRHNPLAYFTAVFRLWWKILFHHPKYDVIHAHHAFSAIIARLQWVLPLVVTIHEGDANKQGPKALLARIAIAGATQPVAVNRTIGSYLRDSRTKIIPCGIDTRLFQHIERTASRMKLGWDQQEMIVLFGSDPTRPEKRYNLAQSTLAELTALGKTARLFPLQGVAREQVPLIMNACDSLLVTSDYESGPLVVKEALAVGLPVVSVPVGDVNEVCRDKRNCYIVEGSPRILAIALLAALEVSPKDRIMQLSYWYDQEFLTGEIIKVYRTFFKS